MGLSRKPETKSSKTRPPATTPEARENQLISLAVDLVEKRLINGSASSQETTHFLKLGSTQAKLEKAELEQRIELAKAKTEAIHSAKRQEELFAKALRAMRSYQGDEQGDENEN